MTNTPSEKAVRAPFSGDDASEQAVLHTLRTHYVDGLRRTFVFGGRSTRGQYWGFLAVNMAVLLALLALGFIDMSAEPNYWVIPAAVYVIPAMLANLSNAVRRLRDTGISPFWVLIGWLGPPPAGLRSSCCFYVRQNQLRENQGRGDSYRTLEVEPLEPVERATDFSKILLRRTPGMKQVSQLKRASS